MPQVLIPKASVFEAQSGVFPLSPSCRIIPGPPLAETRRIAVYLRDRLRTLAGLDLPVRDPGPAVEKEEGAIVLALAGPGSGIPPEGYRLEIRPRQARLVASSPPGLFYAAMSFCGLVNPPPDGSARTIACVRVEDGPAFAWRGIMLDCSRRFLDKAFLKRSIDILAMLKMNFLHLHLTDDQGWRVEIEAYPELTRTGAFVEEERSRRGFYAKEDLREIVRYAEQRHIMVIPEIDLPGHSFAAVKSYPWLCCTENPVRNPGHQKDLYCAGKEEVFEFLETVLSEVMDLFPAPYLHIGGDEAPKDRWRECPRCRDRIQRENLAGPEELQGYLNRRLARVLESRGRRMIGWEEILDGGPPEDAIIHWWQHRTRGTEYLKRAFEKGHSVIASPNSYCYLSFPLKPDGNFREDRTSNLRKVYLAGYLSEAEFIERRSQVLGVEGCVWTKFLEESEIDQRVFPRILALSEHGWASAENREFSEFRDRVRLQREWWKVHGVEMGEEG